MGFFSFIEKGRNLVPMEKRSKNVAFFLMLMATALDNMNVSAAFVSTTSIQERFDATTTQVTWVVSAYALTLGSFIVLFGKIADIIGPHNVFLIGASFMSLFSLIVAVIEDSIVALIIFRALQGLAGAALIPSSYGITVNYFMGPNLGTALRYLIIALTASIGIGMILGGAFAESSIGYKGFYYFSFAMAFVSSSSLFFLIIPVTKTAGHKAMKFKNMDFYATSGIVVGMLLIILGFTEGGNSWHSPKAYVPLPIGIVVLAATFAFEVGYVGRYQDKVRGTPNENSDNWKNKLLLVFPSTILQLPNFYPFAVTLSLIFIGYISGVLALVDYHVYLLHESGILTAVKIFPLSISICIAAVLFKFPYALKIGYKKCIIISNTIGCVAYIWISRVQYDVPHSYWRYLFFPLILYGLSINIFFQVYINVISAAAPLHLQSNVSGIFQTCNQIGIALGSALSSTVMGNITSATSKDVIQKRVTNSLYISIATSAAAVLVSFAVKQHEYVAPGARKPAPEPAPVPEGEIVASEPKEAVVDDGGEENVSEGSESQQNFSDSDLAQKEETNDAIDEDLEKQTPAVATEEHQ